MVNCVTKIKKDTYMRKKLSDHGIFEGHLNLNETERSAFACNWKFNALKICKITVAVSLYT